MVSFTSIGFVAVKLKISEVLRTKGVWVFTPPIWSSIVKILTRGSTLPNKSPVLKDPSIYGKGADPKLAVLG